MTTVRPRPDDHDPAMTDQNPAERDPVQTSAQADRNPRGQPRPADETLASLLDDGAVSFVTERLDDPLAADVQVLAHVERAGRFPDDDTILERSRFNPTLPLEAWDSVVYDVRDAVAGLLAGPDGPDHAGGEEHTDGAIPDDVAAAGGDGRD